MTDKTYGLAKLTIGQMHFNRQDADAAGHSHSFTGVPCIHDHLILRKTKIGVCLECLKNNQRKYYAKIRKSRRNLTDPEKILKQKAHYHANRERILQRGKEYREANREKIKIQRQQHYQENKERLSQKNRKWYQANKEKDNQKNRVRCNKNREKEIARAKAYYHKDKEQILEKRREYRQENKDKISLQNRAYYQKLKAEKEYN